MTSALKIRPVKGVLVSVPQLEGEGAVVRRSIGRRELRNYDPFLLLDEFRSEFKRDGETPKGFPDHPHRGFETVTYMLEGSMAHEDFCGHKGVISTGGLQWMTAGRGIVHCEMPSFHSSLSSEFVKIRGLQLWINLQASEKLCEPHYQELSPSQIPTVVSRDGVRVRVIAGRAFDGTESSVFTKTPTLFLDITLQPHAELTSPTPPAYRTFAYTIDGSGVFVEDDQSGEEQVGASTTVTFGDGEAVYAKASDKGLRFVLIGGEPIGEPVAQRGPFVMNTFEEIAVAYEDYMKGKNGFELAPGWESEEMKRRKPTR